MRSVGRCKSCAQADSQGCLVKTNCDVPRGSTSSVAETGAAAFSRCQGAWTSTTEHQHHELYREHLYIPHHHKRTYLSTNSKHTQQYQNSTRQHHITQNASRRRSRRRTSPLPPNTTPITSTHPHTTNTPHSSYPNAPRTSKSPTTPPP